MNVLLRHTQTEKSIRRRRQTAGTPAVRPGRFDDSSPGRRRLHGPTQDTAVYNCRCGFVFEAAVSTSVGCPHCGGGQAW
jgi:hypothetical protein